MKERTKQIVTGIAANILFLPPIYFAFINTETRTNWKIILLSFVPFILVIGTLRCIWGLGTFRKSTWRDEGFSSLSEWFRKSESFNARFFRFNLKYIGPVLIGFSVISGLAILLSK